MSIAMPFASAFHLLKIGGFFHDTGRVLTDTHVTEELISHDFHVNLSGCISVGGPYGNSRQ